MKVASWITAVVVALAIGFSFVQRDITSPEPNFPYHVEHLRDADGALDAFANALKIPTVGDGSAENHVQTVEPFEALHSLFKRRYKKIYSNLNVETVNKYSLVITWEGIDTSLRPLVLMSHQDVVPASTPEAWTHGPFSGIVADGYVWGRGTLDTKGTLIGILEAVEQLLEEGFKPTRTVILTFGHDEELGGEYGTGSIVKMLAARGVRPEMVLDEGGQILTDGLKSNSITIVPGPMAVVGTAEKGIQNWKIEVSGAGGHASMPPTGLGTSTAARISRILNRLESDLTSTRLAPPTTDFLLSVGRNSQNTIIRNLLKFADHRLLNAALGQVLGIASPELAAMVRSTVAVVGIHAGGDAHNVLPATGNIVLNVRTIPGDDVEAVEQYIKYSVQKEPVGTTNVSLLDHLVYQASPVSPSHGKLWDALVQAIQETTSRNSTNYHVARAPAVVPYMVLGRTDSSWYTEIASGRVFRFSPIKLNQSAGDLKLIHGVDERIPVEDWLDTIRFFLRFIKLFTGESMGE